MLYVFVVCACLALITGVLGFHGVLRQGLPIVYGLFAFFMAGWIANLVAMLVLALWRRLRSAPRHAG